MGGEVSQLTVSWRSDVEDISLSLQADRTSMENLGLGLAGRQAGFYSQIGRSHPCREVSSVYLHILGVVFSALVADYLTGSPPAWLGELAPSVSWSNRRLSYVASLGDVTRSRTP